MKTSRLIPWLSLASIAQAFTIRTASVSVSSLRQYRQATRLHQPILHSTIGSDPEVFERPKLLDNDAETAAMSSQSIGTLVFLLPENQTVLSKFGASSPVGRPLLLEAIKHIAHKADNYAEGLLNWKIVSLSSKCRNDDYLTAEISQAEMVIAIGLDSPAEIAYTRSLFERRRQSSRQKKKKDAKTKHLCHFALDCMEQLPALVGPYDSATPSLRSKRLPWTRRATGRRLHNQITTLFSRWTSDDFCFAIMFFLNEFSGTQLEWVKHRIDAAWEKGPVKNVREFAAMMTQCRDCIVPCLKDAKCRECLGKLGKIDPRDQATSYRTLVSYESELLSKFSLCIFTRKNIFKCDATVPTIPYVPPIVTWRGKTVTEEVGRALMVGHLDDEFSFSESLRLPMSWMVACGANAAYDQFPSQHQLFYPASRSRDLWYDPVFRVETLDGRNIWCKRHYKVRPAAMPGTFRFSVLDNGVTTDEFWTIVGAADDLSWVVFHYAGAAKAVGLRYLGGLLCTSNGSMPDDIELPTIWKCLASAGIQPWELYLVDNRLDSPSAISAGPPPLDFYRHGVRTKQETQEAAVVF